MTDWYYEKDGAQAGPVPEAQISQLRASAAISDQTLVWRAGFSDWQPLGGVPEFESAEVAASQPAGDGLKLKRAAVKSTLEQVKSTQPSLAPENIWKDDFDQGPSQAEIDAFGQTFWRSFEFRFFIWSFGVAVLATIPMFLLKQHLFYLPLLVQAILSLFIAGLIFRIRTFQESIWWGIGGILIGITDLIFLILHWDRARHSFLLSVFGFGVFLGGVVGLSAASRAGLLEWWEYATNSAQLLWQLPVC
ncbi:MAG: DUF4339 domain-containing protein [Verrucomicrobiota bacterium]